MKNFLFFISLIVCCTFDAQSNYSNQSKLTLEEIMKGNEFIGHQPENHRFLPNGNLLFDWRKGKDSIARTYHLEVSSGLQRPLTEDEIHSFPLNGFEWHKSRTFCIYINNGALFKWNIKQKSPQLIWLSRDPIVSVQTVDNPNHLYFQQGNDVFKLVFQGENIQLTQITQFVKTLPSKDKELTWLENQQRELFEYANTTPKANHQNNSSNSFSLPEPIATGQDYVGSVSISPDEKYLTFTQSTYTENEATHYMHYLDVSGYAKSKTARPKVGIAENKHKMGVIDLKNKTHFYIDESNLEGINTPPNFLSKKGITTYTNKGVYVHKTLFSATGEYAVVEIKSLDNKHRWIAQLDFEKKQYITLIHQYDEAWIGGPGISSWKEVPGVLGWIGNEPTFYFQSEKTGYSHLYTYSLTTKKETALTSGPFEIHQVVLSKDFKKMYVTANKTHPGNRGFYQLEIATQKLTPVFEKDGNFDVQVSPQETHLCYLYSGLNEPWELFGCENSLQPKNSIQLTQSTTENFKKYPFRKPKVVPIKARDERSIYARLYEPEKQNKNGAAIIFVHGAGYLQNAHNYWSSYYREYLFHNFLVDNGYTVLDMDYRGSEGYGRDWRTGIYRHMGGKDLTDHLDGRNYLIQNLGIDSTRVGIYGGSYGGFITLMALFTAPGKFKCGAALRSVTDWAHYNHEYTSNILNTPEEDEEAFRKSSPIYFAQNLSDRLLILHGVLDDNVQYQDVVRLQQRLIELQKDNWELASYPIEPHGFKTTTSWIDEYKRIYKLFEEELKP